MKKIAVIPGDGIGIDVTEEAIKVLEAVKSAGVDINWDTFDYGADKYLETGITLPDEEVENFRENYDAIYIGAVGDPRVPDMHHAKEILLGLRFKLDLYVNYRPVKLYQESLCPLKNKTMDDIDFVVFRENTEGLYAGTGGIIKQGTPDEVAIQTSINTRKGVERIIRHAFEYAKMSGRPRVTMSDKSNAMRFEGDLWQRAFAEVGEEYPDIEKQHWYIDALLMQMVKRPEQFEVIVSCNMFGDIITDLGAQLAGGMGLAGSGNIHPGRTSLFEPVHGSAPKYHGKDIANPLAAILTVGIMLEHLGYPDWNTRIENAVIEAVKTNNVPRDLGGSLGTSASGDYIVSLLES
ncbi:3-isopropylmalate dehydrogenase [candidate division LCP-89 bacterium B3_LCP]|uniref:3-isopropylmalate dehydrogenase n=1 Tax=candidate division LCP-89 bacterium B3_LCP TaxID=2012998 RepID=A0A532UYJ5_UNCL8|nr:MAG: 3-isopropylmalate dehydrogenase [candidate division LCP-89 bacterium B3_LCP]